MSTKFIAAIASVRNTPSSLNRHGNAFSGSNRQLDSHWPGAINNIHATAAQQSNAKSTRSTTLLNPNAALLFRQ
ncbi:hypothetical protein [Pantoea stewartii]|uniref:hypothetical protein n=1 Tax=Pantoea stewartii TaxID=66269 RepID=UPI0025A24C8A|nr:hypothetical protein [Pantoea stewartii]